MSVALTQKEVTRLRRLCAGLLDRSEANGCVVCDAGGYVLAEAGRGTEDPLLLSALGAGVFAASRELARLLGEDEFSAVLHQGEKKSILLRAVTADVLLVIIFSASTSVGMVRLYATPAAEEMRALFDEVTAAGQRVVHPEQSFVLTSDGEDLFGSGGKG